MRRNIEIPCSCGDPHCRYDDHYGNVPHSAKQGLEAEAVEVGTGLIEQVVSCSPKEWAWCAIDGYWGIYRHATRVLAFESDEEDAVAIILMWDELGKGGYWLQVEDDTIEGGYLCTYGDDQHRGYAIKRGDTRAEAMARAFIAVMTDIPATATNPTPEPANRRNEQQEKP